MSDDYDIYCTKCKARVETVASRSISYGNKLWCDDEILKELGAFLFAHEGHPLLFDDTQRLPDPDEDEPAEPGTRPDVSLVVK